MCVCVCVCVQVTDPDHSRYEVPLPTPQSLAKAQGSKYTVAIQREPVFSFTVSRADTGVEM